MFALPAFTSLTLGVKRYLAVERNRVDLAFYRLYQDGKEPADLAAYTRHLANLYEAPVLFYAVVIMAYASGNGQDLMLALAWCYVAARYLHSLIHLTSNVVLRRFQAFGLSWLVLIALWAVLAARLIGQPI